MDSFAAIVAMARCGGVCRFLLGISSLLYDCHVLLEYFLSRPGIKSMRWGFDQDVHNIALEGCFYEIPHPFSLFTTEPIFTSFASGLKELFYDLSCLVCLQEEYKILWYWILGIQREVMFAFGQALFYSTLNFTTTNRIFFDWTSSQGVG